MNRSSSRRRRMILLSGLLVLLACGAWYIFRPAHTNTFVEPPAPDLSAIDPAVKEVIEKELNQVRESPDSGPAWGRLGLALHTHIFAPEAMTCFVRAEELEPWNPRWPYFQALIMLAEDPPAALPKLRRTLELCGDDVDGPRLRLAEIAQRSGLDAEAASHFDVLIQHTPGHPRAHLGLARIRVQRDDPGTSKDHLKFALEHPTSRKSAHLLLAEVHQRAGDTIAARRERARATELPEDAEWSDRYVAETAPFQVGESAGLRRASSLIDRRRVDEASQSLHRLVRDYPRSSAAWTLLGWLQLNQNKLTDAESSLRAAIEHDSKHARAWFYLGLVQYRKNERTKALEAWSKAIEYKPTYLEAYFNMGICLKEQMQREPAIAAFENALRCQPLSAPALAHLGTLLIEKGEGDRGIEHLKQAVELNPDDSASRKLLEIQLQNRNRQ